MREVAMSVLKSKRKASQFEVFHHLNEKDFTDWYQSWFRNHYRIMSRQQRENMDKLYKELKEEYQNVQNQT